MADGWGAASQVEGLWIRCREGVEPDRVHDAIEAHRAHDARGRDACDQWGERSSVSRVDDWAVKWAKWRGVRGALSDCVYRSRAQRARVGAARLSSIGVRGVEPIAVAERRRFGLVKESFLVTRYLDRAQPLSALAPTLVDAPNRRRALVESVGDQIGALHAAGLHHADLKHSNLLVAPDGRVHLADLDALVPRRRLSWRRRVRALGQLEAYARDLYPWLPATDRARFVRAYLAHQPQLRDERRRLLADVGAWAEQKVESWSRQVRTDRLHFPLAPRAPRAVDPDA